MTKRKKIIFIFSTLILVPIVTAVLWLNGLIGFNDLRVRKYTVRGVDVSSYQGDIDWKVLSSQDIDFAFIKATEGSSYTDPKFQYNWEQAQQTSLQIGAYHFFSYDSSGATQAQNFISAVPELDTLPPVVDIEFYGEYGKNPLPKEAVSPILNELLFGLEEQYGKKPILYATQKSYELYLQDEYTDYPLWIRNILREPQLQEGQAWTFWQYSDRKKLDGYSGKEPFIDMNVFNRTQNDFADWITARP